MAKRTAKSILVGYLRRRLRAFRRDIDWIVYCKGFIKRCFKLLMHFTLKTGFR